MNSKDQKRLPKLAIAIWHRIKGFIPSGEIANKAKSFVLNVCSIKQLHEKKNIENMMLYLKTVGELVSQLEKAGVSKREIRDLLIQLNVPAIEATLKVMILMREQQSATFDSEVKDQSLKHRHRTSSIDKLEKTMGLSGEVKD